MQAIVCHEFGNPGAVTAVQGISEPPPPAPDEVLIQVGYASVSHATGLLIEGRYQKHPPLPFVPGTEGVGAVLQCGAGVSHVKPGKPVAFICDWGAYGERVAVHGATVYPLPEGLDPLHALAIPISYGTAYTAMHWRAQIQQGDAILVLGAGSGVGAAAVELARQIPGVQVIACASTAAKRSDALRRGAHHAVEPAQLVEQVKRITGGKGADLVFDPVGGELLLMALKATAQYGKIVSIGFASGSIPQLPMNMVLVKNLTVYGYFYGRYIGWTPANERVRYQQPMQAMMAELFALTARKAIQPRISQVFPMAQLCEALDALHGRDVLGKIAIRVKGEPA